MRKIRVLVVDDSVVVRKILTETLKRDRDIEVLGTAPNGKIAVDKIGRLHPDVVTLDIEMPVMNGLEALAELKRRGLTPKVLMLSSLTTAGGHATLEALDRGAADYVTKPVGQSLTETEEILKVQLIPKIKQFFPEFQTVRGNSLIARRAAAQRAKAANSDRSASALSSAGAPSATAPTGRPAKVRRVDLLAIGSSTGGPKALERVLVNLPANLGVPVVITQHMPPVFTRMLANRLNEKVPLRVHEATSGMAMEPDNAYIAPGDFHMVVRRKGTRYVLELNQDAPENSCRPAVDPMFRSVAREFGAGVLAVVLTGMGADGARGAEVIKEAGGVVFAQDEATSVVWGMPGAVVQAEAAERVLPLDDVAPSIIRKIAAGRRPGRAASARGAR